jgi:hypothetical protein
MALGEASGPRLPPGLGSAASGTQGPLIVPSGKTVYNPLCCVDAGPLLG